MIRKRRKFGLYAFCTSLSVIALLVMLDVRVDLRIGTVFRVFPAQQWVLAKGSEAQITSSIRDYRSAVSNNISVIQFERGESMNFHLSPSVMSRSQLSDSDTVAVLSSSRLQERLIGLRGDLQIAKANLAARSAGEKRPLIDQYRRQVEYSAAKIAEKRIPYARQAELFKRGYVSKEEYELAQAELRAAELEHEIDKAQLSVFESGSKDEDLQVLRMTIDTRLREIDALKARLREYVLRSPVSGEIIRNYSTDTLLIVNNTSCLIFSAPVRYEKAQYLSEGSRVEIRLKNFSQPLQGTLISISKEAETINGVQILPVRICVDKPSMRIVPGLTMPGDIVPARITLLEYVYSLFDAQP